MSIKNFHCVCCGNELPSHFMSVCPYCGTDYSRCYYDSDKHFRSSDTDPSKNENDQMKSKGARDNPTKGTWDNSGGTEWELLLLLFLLSFMDPPRREITVRAENGGKSVNIDPHNAEAVEAAEAWRKALLSEPSQSALDGLLKRIRREGYCCPSGSFSEKPAETVKRGHWKKSDILNEKYVCSVCGGACWYYDYQGDVAKSRYCPNCGARMKDVM